MSNCKEPFNWEQMLSFYWWKLLFFRVSGGRPMIDEGHNFTDVVDGKSVRNYTDRFGNEWLASNGAWSIFRVRRSHQVADALEKQHEKP